MIFARVMKNRIPASIARNLICSLGPNTLFPIQASPSVSAQCTGRNFTYRTERLRSFEDVSTSLLRQQLGTQFISASRPRYLSTNADANGVADPYGVVSEDRANLQEVLDLLNEKKAESISVLDSSVLTALKTLCKYMVIISCSSRRHMKVVADHVSEHYKLKGLLIEYQDDDGLVEHKPPSIEGADSESWMLVDLGDIIVQIFSYEGRDTFRLEEHWADVDAAREAGLTYQDFIDRKGAAAAAVASSILKGAAPAATIDAAAGEGGGAPKRP